MSLQQECRKCYKAKKVTLWAPSTGSGHKYNFCDSFTLVLVDNNAFEHISTKSICKYNVMFLEGCIIFYKSFHKTRLGFD